MLYKGQVEWHTLEATEGLVFSWKIKRLSEAMEHVFYQVLSDVTNPMRMHSRYYPGFGSIASLEGRSSSATHRIGWLGEIETLLGQKCQMNGERTPGLPVIPG